MTVAECHLSIHSLCDQLEGLLREFAADISDFQVRRVGAAGVDPLAPAHRESDLAANDCPLLHSLEELQVQIAGIRGELDARERLLQSLHLESRTDGLTKLLNRRAFDEELLQRSIQARRGTPVALLMLDIDHFKLVNDTHGHAAGDKVLRGVANVLNNALREMDVVARVGGEEFGVLLPDTTLLDACRVAERVRTAVGTSTIQHDDEQLGITISIGVAALACAESETHAAQQADKALYEAKRAGRNCVFVFRDGVCQPLRQHDADGRAVQRRRYVRFLVENFQIFIRGAGVAWHAADVLDESLEGIGVMVAGPAEFERYEKLQINYCGELRQAELMHLAPSEQGLRLGLRWIDRPWHDPVASAVGDAS